MSKSDTLPLADAIEAFFQWLTPGTESAKFEAWAEWDFTLSQMRMLMILGHRREPLPINELAAHVELSVAAGGRSVDRLVKAGLLERVECAHDRRIRLVSLAPLGREVLEKLAAVKRRHTRELLSQVNPADREHLHAALTAVLAGAHDTPTPED